MQFLTFDENFVTVTIVSIYEASMDTVKINGKDLLNALNEVAKNYYYNDNTIVEILDEDCNIVTVDINRISWTMYQTYYFTNTDIRLIRNLYTK